MSGVNILKYKEDLNIIHKEGKTHVFDPLRRKYVVLQPEEMVRQLFIQYLIQELKIPKKHIAVERQISINGKLYRFDILVFNKTGQPKMIVECKSHKIGLTEGAAIQASKYNMALKAEYLCLTNGKYSFFYKIDSDKGTIKQISNYQ